MATDFVLVTDLTGSFTDDISNIQEAIPPIARSLRGVGEDSQFALASFRDFADDFGTNGYRPDLPLTSSIADLEDTVGGYSAFGGGDGPEAQGTALIEAARGTGLELREGSERIILLSTDALNKIGNSGRPTVDEVRTALEENNATPVFLATDGALSAYQDLIEEIGSGVALEISRDSADLSDTVREAVAELLGVETDSLTDDADDFTGTDEAEDVFGRGGDDTLTGGGGDDVVDGGSGDDDVSGGDGDDEVRGGSGDDEVDGGAGNDIVEGNLGRDFLTGGGGNNTFVGTVSELAGDVITDFDPDDRIVFSGATFSRDDVGVTFASAILDIDTDGDGTRETRLTLEGDFSAETTDFDVTNEDGDTIITLGDGVEPPPPPPELEENAFLTLTDATPSEFYLGEGLVVQLVGSTGGKTVNIPDEAAGLGIAPNTTVNLEAASADLTFTRNGTSLEITGSGGNAVASLNAATDSRTDVIFADGATELAVSGTQITFGGQTFADGDSFDGGALSLDTSTTSDGIFDGGSGATVVDLDDLGGTLTAPATLDAGDGSFRFDDSASRNSVTEITNFGADDQIQIDGTTGDVAVSVSDGNTTFEFNDGEGTASVVTLVGVSGFFTNVSEFNADPDLGNVTFA